MGIPTDILRFFGPNNAIVEGYIEKPLSAHEAINHLKEFVEVTIKDRISEGKEAGEIRDEILRQAKKIRFNPHTIQNFLEDKPHLNSLQILQICRKLSREGFLHKLISKNDSMSPLKEAYFTASFDEKLAKYGVYDFFIEGFTAIRANFINSVRPIIIRKNQLHDIGTCFDIGNGFIITARHCIEGMDNIQIPYHTGFETIKNIYVDKDERFDLAVIETENKINGNPSFSFANEIILEEVLTMGYPPIPGFEALQLAEVTRINSYLKATTGSIIGAGIGYLEAQHYMLINAKVKGGNSGGPVINKRGEVVGVLVQIPLDTVDSSQLDTLGYGVAIPTSLINPFLHQINEMASNVVRIPFVNNGNGFSTV